MALVIQIGNWPDSTDTVVLRRLFETFGTVRSAMINTHYETGRSTGVAFVEMTSEHEGDAAIAALNHREYGGQVLSVCRRNATGKCASDSPSVFQSGGTGQLKANGREQHRQWEE